MLSELFFFIIADNSRRFEVERPPTRSGGQKQSDGSPSGEFPLSITSLMISIHQ